MDIKQISRTKLGMSGNNILYNTGHIVRHLIRVLGSGKS